MRPPSCRSCPLDATPSLTIVPCRLPPNQIYDLWDLGEFDQKGGKRTGWGTKEELIQAIKVARENGVLSYIDAVRRDPLPPREQSADGCIPPCSPCSRSSTTSASQS